VTVKTFIMLQKISIWTVVHVHLIINYTCVLWFQMQRDGVNDVPYQMQCK